jgi:hypothetical protein
MKPGDKVKIYQKPLTQEDYEGEAILHTLIYKDNYIAHWWVQFTDEPIERQRSIILESINNDELVQRYKLNNTQNL